MRRSAVSLNSARSSGVAPPMVIPMDTGPCPGQRSACNSNRSGHDLLARIKASESISMPNTVCVPWDANETVVLGQDSSITSLSSSSSAWVRCKQWKRTDNRSILIASCSFGRHLFGTASNGASSTAALGLSKKPAGSGDDDLRVSSELLRERPADSQKAMRRRSSPTPGLPAAVPSPASWVSLRSSSPTSYPSDTVLSRPGTQESSRSLAEKKRGIEVWGLIGESAQENEEVARESQRLSTMSASSASSVNPVVAREPGAWACVGRGPGPLISKRKARMNDSYVRMLKAAQSWGMEPSTTMATCMASGTTAPKNRGCREAATYFWSRHLTLNSVAPVTFQSTLCSDRKADREAKWRMCTPESEAVHTSVRAKASGCSAPPEVAAAAPSSDSEAAAATPLTPGASPPAAPPTAAAQAPLPSPLPCSSSDSACNKLDLSANTGASKGAQFGSSALVGTTMVVSLSSTWARGLPQE
mmetsp:Transcript_46174/g.148257  ORF Transcript_46174/g.148257 Transcript_46174/m.148257 type:complete len:474 (+) Transcript_46174:2667-4088(+)